MMGDVAEENTTEAEGTTEAEAVGGMVATETVISGRPPLTASRLTVANCDGATASIAPSSGSTEEGGMYLFGKLLTRQPWSAAYIRSLSKDVSGQRNTAPSVLFLTMERDPQRQAHAYAEDGRGLILEEKIP